MRVCVICIEYPPSESGVGIACHRIVDNLSKKVEMHVLTYSSAKDSVFSNMARELDSKAEDGVKVHRMSPYSGTLTHVPPQEVQNICFYLEKLHKKHKFDIIHGFNLNGSGFAAVYMAKKLGLKSIVSVRGNDIGRDLFEIEKLYGLKWVLENAGHVTYVAEDLKNNAMVVSEHKATVIHNSLNPFEFFFKDIKLKLDGFVICFSGVVRRKKGFAYLVEAFAKFRKKHKATLLIVGELMPEEKISHLKMIDKHGVSGDVMITGMVRHNIILNYINLADAFVLPAISEGCSNSLLEAMYCGKPCIATKVGAAKQIIRHNKSGLLVEPHSSESIYKALVKLKNSKKLRNALSSEAKNSILKNCSPEIEQKKWLAVYKNVK